jgi:hypothetical protein
MERSPYRKSTSCSTSHETPFRLFYYTRLFNYAFQKLQHRSLSQARLNQFTSPILNTTEIYVIGIKHITEWISVAGLCQSCTLRTEWINTSHFVKRLSPRDISCTTTVTPTPTSKTSPWQPHYKLRRAKAVRPGPLSKPPRSSSDVANKLRATVSRCPVS